MIHGVITIQKEAGYTSHDVVAKLRGICKQKKIGHTGTLDPEATGVLPVCLGNATKLCDMITDKTKEYRAVMLLGVATDTQDATGKVLETREISATEDEVREACLSFVGGYEQIPPMYSALKVDGKKLYELARAGKEVERRPRRVEIYKLEILSVVLPRVEFSVECSKGTYIRTLCADIGDKLGCGACMESLVRTRVGAFTLKDSLTLSEVEELRDKGEFQSAVIPVESVFGELHSLQVKAPFGKLLRNGNPIGSQETVQEATYADGEWVKLYGEDGRFCGIYAYDGGYGKYRPVKMFLEEE